MARAKKCEGGKRCGATCINPTETCRIDDRETRAPASCSINSKPCGRSCIAKDKVCRTRTPRARRPAAAPLELTFE
jgi:hypothetical protein